MSATELDEVVTLLMRILPDPRAYGDRLLRQALQRWADSGPSIVQGRGRDSFNLADLVVYAESEDADPDRGARRDASGGRADQAGVPDRTDPSATVPRGVDGDADSGSSTGIALVLAAALGACDCWGLRDDCPTCRGKGSSGWIDPDIDLFQEYVSPAAARLSRLMDDGHVPDRETPVHRNG